MRWKAKLYKEEQGFTLLELVMVVAVVGMLATALGGTIISQYEIWQFNTNQAKVVENSELFISYLEKDISQAIDYELVNDQQLELKLDKNQDGVFEATSSDELVTYSQSNLEQYSEVVTDIKFTKAEARLIKVDISLKSGDFKEQITKYFHIGSVNYTTN
ncbi:prepilin-type N-terminal cleavage/methylation domain-containing protein [Halanaerobacter jeridensis]|uniref:Prepilin-type N-terminal cleavage/methylation domain-containing protein n=1 Tax=Halanaerobacter jeridensis TaxID=706427 RepID=A0A939BNI3_9FIRM|nr:prepilin-type N-terminal cleavage/methylation domain-containing protein [Halanaerobacter jeridensis]